MHCKGNIFKLPLIISLKAVFICCNAVPDILDDVSSTKTVVTKVPYSSPFWRKLRRPEKIKQKEN